MESYPGAFPSLNCLIPFATSSRDAWLLLWIGKLWDWVQDDNVAGVFNVVQLLIAFSPSVLYIFLFCQNITVIAFYWLHSGTWLLSELLNSWVSFVGFLYLVWDINVFTYSIDPFFIILFAFSLNFPCQIIIFWFPRWVESVSTFSLLLCDL